MNAVNNGRLAVYKPSDVAWLGNVPSHWDLPRMKRVFAERVEKGFPDEPPLAATQTMGVVRKDRYENRTVVALKDLHLLKRVLEGDFVISLRSFQGGIEFAHDQGIISPAYTILDSDARYVDDGYFTHLFKSAPYIENLKLHVTGIRQGQNIDYTKLSRSNVPLPPLPEQRAIAQYLDFVDRRIQRYIRAKERMIGLLDEQKRAVINQAVTRGLDPDVPLKPSGVEWLGDVPAHWEVRGLKHWVGINDEVLTESADADYAFNYIDIGSVTAGRLTEQPTRMRFGGAPSRARRIVRNGDTIISTVRTYLKAVWYADIERDQDLICSTGFAVLRPLGETIPKFVSFSVQSDSFADRISASSVGVAYPAISESRLGSFSVSIPPIDEQSRIAGHLDIAVAKIDCHRSRAHQQIELIKEYRTRLIADVVTGKLDVRDAAANLPEKLGEDGLLDLSGDLERLEAAKIR